MVHVFVHLPSGDKVTSPKRRRQKKKRKRELVIRTCVKLIQSVCKGDVDNNV